VLPGLEILGSTYTKPPFCPHQVPASRRPQVVEEGISDPAYSPAYHTRTLSVLFPQVVVAVEEGGWIRMFPRVVRLVVYNGGLENLYGSDVSLAPFQSFSPVLKSLRVISGTIPHSQVLDLACSLPLLEDLCVIEYGWDGSHRDGPVFQHSTSPASTGTLELHLTYGMEDITHRLLGLPNGLHFRKLVCTWSFEEHVLWMTPLVMGCFDTLECVDIDCRLYSTFPRLLCLRSGPYSDTCLHQ